MQVWYLFSDDVRYSFQFGQPRKFLSLILELIKQYVASFTVKMIRFMLAFSHLSCKIEFIKCNVSCYSYMTNYNFDSVI